MTRILALLSLFLILPGCGPSTSGVDPEKTFENITDAEVEALCQWQEDLLGTEPIECCWGESAYDYAGCVAQPPLRSPGFETVAQFEDCTRARADDPCVNDHPSCFRFACM